MSPADAPGQESGVAWGIDRGNYQGQAGRVQGPAVEYGRSHCAKGCDNRTDRLLEDAMQHKMSVDAHLIWQLVLRSHSSVAHSYFPSPSASKPKSGATTHCILGREQGRDSGVYRPADLYLSFRNSPSLLRRGRLFILLCILLVSIEARQL